MSTDLDLENLEELARAATPGPWKVRYEPAGKYGGGDELHVDSETSCVSCTMSDAQEQQARPDADFIAATHPGTVLALIETIKIEREQCEADKDCLRRNHRLQCDRANAAQARIAELEAALIEACDYAGSNWEGVPNETKRYRHSRLAALREKAWKR